jgi:periplasmic protein TonB
MRTYTFVFSVCAHALAVGALIIVPALATDDLPEPRRTSAFIVVRPVLPPPIAIPASRKETAQRIESPAVAVPSASPVEMVDAVDDAPNPGTSLTGIPFGEVGSNGDLIPLPPPPPPPPAPPRPTDPVRVGGFIQPPTRQVYVAPIYPPIALAARKEGLVILEALIAEDGTIRDVKALRPEPLFEQAAITAVRQWRFSPTLLNGERVPIVMTVTVGFSLD